MRVVTHYFVDLLAAAEYYARYGYDDPGREVERKLDEGEIVIGPPEAKEGERLGVDEDGRYYIEGGRR